jgi:uncharacterized protein with FMN-binding domain
VARAAIIAGNEAEIAEVEAYNRQIQLENAKRQAASLYYENGTYEGTGSGYGGAITVSVTIEYDVLTDIHVVSCDGEDPAYFSQAQAVIDEILSTQGVAVYTVSGATFSSTGLINAVTEALRAASK